LLDGGPLTVEDLAAVSLVDPEFAAPWPCRPENFEIRLFTGVTVVRMT
jgi:hypothetical protein